MKLNQNKILIIAIFLLAINLLFSEELKVVEVGKVSETIVEVGVYNTTTQGIEVTTENAIDITVTSGSGITTVTGLELTTGTAINNEKIEKSEKYVSEDYNEVEGTVQKGQATYYAKKFHGRKTTSGEKFSIYKYTGAHRTLKFGTMVKVTNVDNGKTVVVRINDRGPFTKGKIIDLSPVAFEELAKLSKGVINVKIEVLEGKTKNSKIEKKEEIKKEETTKEEVKKEETKVEENKVEATTNDKNIEIKEEIPKNEVKSSK